MSRTVLLLALTVGVTQSAAAQNNLWSVRLTWEGDRLVAGAPVRITGDSTGGGPSQPAITPDGKAIVYTATRDTGASARSDIYKRDLTTLVETRVTRTAEHENSPTVTARGEYVAVRWQPATLFREMGVWFYSSDGTPVRALLPAADTVGYYTELRDGRFALVQPRAQVWTLALFDPATKRTIIIDSAISAVVRAVPGEQAISYVKTTSDNARTPIDIRKYDLASGRITILAPVYRGAGVHSWAARNTLLMAQGNGLVAYRTGRDTAWQRVATFTDPQIRQATAVAASPQGDHLVLISPRRASLAVVVNDSLDAGRNGAAVTSMVRALRTSGRIADYNANEGVMVGLVNTAVTRRSAADAIALAQLATEMFPNSHRAFASLGDAQQAGGDKPSALVNWKKALDLNSRATNADRNAATAVEAKISAAGSGTAGAGAAGAHDMHSMHNMGGEIVIPKDAPYTKADVEFMQGMIAHHAQAIVMAQMAEKNGANPQVLKLSNKIDHSQIPEILIMQEWLRRNSQFVPDTSSWHNMRMDGMLTDDELKAMNSAKGVEFDRLFLTGMIKHHAGALKMVDDLFASPRAGQEVDVNVFANDVVVAQTGEIGIMRRLLAQLPPK